MSIFILNTDTVVNISEWLFYITCTHNHSYKYLPQYDGILKSQENKFSWELGSNLIFKVDYLYNFELITQLLHIYVYVWYYVVLFTFIYTPPVFQM